MAQGSGFRRQAVLPHRRRQRHRPRDRAEAGRRGRRAVPHRPRRRGAGRRPSPTPARWAREVPEHRALDISDYDAVAAFAADIHADHPAMDVVMNIAGVSAWGTVDQLTHRALEVDGRHQPDGADPRHRDLRAADGRGAAAAGTWSTCPRPPGWWRCRGTRPTARASTACAGFPRCCASTWPGTASGCRWWCPAR